MHLGVRHPRVLILLLIGLTGLFAGRAAHSEPHALPIVGSPADRAADFDQMWHEVSDNYFYLGDKADSWAGARSRRQHQVPRVWISEEPTDGGISCQLVASDDCLV